MNDHDDEPAGPIIVDPITVSVQTPDVVALRNLQAYSASELTRIQKRSDKWIAGLVAITGVLTTAVVVKGPDSFSKLSDSRELWGIEFSPDDVIIGLMVLGGLAVGLGITLAYSAAYGDPLKDDELATRAKEQKLDGAWAAWSEASEKAAASARGALRNATYATVVGVLFLTLAVLLTWTTPSKPATDLTTCIEGPDGAVELEGSAPAVSEGSLTIIPC